MERPKLVRDSGKMLTRNSFQRPDLIGACLYLAASILLIFALEEGGSKFSVEQCCNRCHLRLVGKYVDRIRSLGGGESLVGRQRMSKKLYFHLD